MDRKYLVLLIFLVCVSISSWFFLKDKKNTISTSVSVAPILQPTKRVEKIYPIAEFIQRITKKPFGIYITPKNSPVQPERFQGFHTGVDVEYEEVESDVPVFAVCDGEIILSKWVRGYGGTLILKCKENYYIYGHLNVNSIVKKTKILKREQIALLGKGNSIETDYERKHLHFSINKKSADLRGYVQNKDELNNWDNPLESDIYKK